MALNKRTLALLAGLALGTGALQVQAQNLVVDNFNDAGAGVSFWAASWGTTPTLTFSTENNGGPAGSGSLRIESPVFVGGSWEQVVIEKTFNPALKPALYTSVSVDVKVDPTSAPTTAGQYGYFELKYGDSGTAFGGINLPATSTNWTTVTFPVPNTTPDVSILRFQLGNGNFTGKVIVNIDNLRFNAPIDYYNQFNEVTEIDAWTPTWGTTPIMEFNTTENLGGPSGSGSLKVAADYFTPEDNGWEQAVITRTFDPVPTSADYAGIVMDVLVDPISVPNADNLFGYFEPKKTTGVAFGGVNLTTNGWRHIEYDFLPTDAEVTAILLQNGSGTFRGPVTYYLDNVGFIRRVGGPKLALAAGPLDDVRRDAVVLNWVLNNGADPVKTDSIQLTLDGQPAEASKITVTTIASGVTVTFDDTGTLWSAGEHAWSISFTDTATPAISVSGQGKFIVNPYPTEGTFVIEAEDWNYDGGKFNPMKGVADMDVDVMPYLGGAYDTLSAVAGVDYNGDDGNDSDLYRKELDATGGNAVNIGENRGGRWGADRGLFDVSVNHRLGWVQGGEWQNYTRTFPSTNYHVWAALSIAGRDPNSINASLDLVTSDATQPGQTTLRLGTFQSNGSDGWGRNTLVPMKDSDGSTSVVAMSGVQTVRFNVGGGDFDYFLFVPTDAPLDPPVITGVSLTAGNITITWTGGGTLWSAPTVKGPWTTTGDSDGTHTMSATTGIEFFRVQR